MTLIQLSILAALAALATLPSVLLIPRARQSPIFDRILWLATWVLALIGALLAPNYIDGISPGIDRVTVAEIPLIASVVGAAVGALSLNAILWLMDRLEGSSAEGEFVEENLSEDENVGTSSTDTVKQQ